MALVRQPKTAGFRLISRYDIYRRPAVKVLKTLFMSMYIFFTTLLILYISGSQTRDKLPPGVICSFLGVTRNQNHNVVLYYERSLEKTFSTGNAKSFY